MNSRLGSDGPYVVALCTPRTSCTLGGPGHSFLRTGHSHTVTGVHSASTTVRAPDTQAWLRIRVDTQLQPRAGTVHMHYCVRTDTTPVFELQQPQKPLLAKHLLLKSHVSHFRRTSFILTIRFMRKLRHQQRGQAICQRSHSKDRVKLRSQLRTALWIYYVMFTNPPSAQQIKQSRRTWRVAHVAPTTGRNGSSLPGPLSV